MRKAVFLALFLAGTFAARATVLLIVDITDLSAVTITATGAPPDADDWELTVDTGITLVNFFATPVAISYHPVDVAGNLLPFGQGNPGYYNSAIPTIIHDGLTDLNLFRYGMYNDREQFFIGQAPAFTGVATLDLSLESGPGSIALGTHELVSGVEEMYRSATPIGEYTVIPEPSSAVLLLGLGVLAYAFAHRKADPKAGVVFATNQKPPFDA